MRELSDAALVARLIQAVADDPRKLYYSTPEGAYVDRDVEAARQAVLARMTPAAARPTPDADIDPSVTIPPQRTREAKGRVVNRRNGTPSDLLDTTPDAEAMEREFVAALKEFGRTTRYAEHHHSNHARKGDFEGVVIDAENALIDLYRTAVRS